MVNVKKSAIIKNESIFSTGSVMEPADALAWN